MIPFVPVTVSRMIAATVWALPVLLHPTATDWARWSGTIDYEIVTRMGGRQTRLWVDSEQDTAVGETVTGGGW